MKSVLAFSLALLGASFGFAQHDHAKPVASDSDSAATCPVSGDKLGAMGDPVKYVYKQPGKPDRVIQFCCDDCIKDFEKDPAKYLAKLDTGKTEAAAPHAHAAAAPAVIDAYLPVAEALAADDLGKARTAAAALATKAKPDGLTSVVTQANAVAKAESLDAARSAFKSLSKEVVPLAQDAKGYVVMNCPMANADWVQNDTNVRNPYFGKMMLTCGAPKK